MLDLNALHHRPFTLTRLIAWLALLFILALATLPHATRHSQAASHKRQSLTFEERVAYQRAIEAVSWQHRIWPKDNPQPKPSLDEVMPESAMRAKVEDYLRQSNALERYWQQPITGEQLQVEMERMARDTKQPEVLRELWAALGNDPFIIAECLARPLLAQRLSRSLYASDERFHGELKRRAEAELSQPDAAARMKQMSGEYRETTWIKAERAADARHHTEQPGTFLVDAEQWPEQVQKLTASVQSTAFRRVLAGREKSPAEAGTLNTLAAAEQLPVGQLSGLQEDGEKFSAVMVMEQSEERIKVASVEWKKAAFDEWWSGVRAETESNLSVPRFEYRLPEIEAAFVRYEGGAEALTSADVPTARERHTAVWTGSEMIVWGGIDNNFVSINTGGRYNPATDSWTSITTTAAPSARAFHTAVWTGSEMIVWGGVVSFPIPPGGGTTQQRTHGQPPAQPMPPVRDLSTSLCGQVAK